MSQTITCAFVNFYLTIRAECTIMHRCTHKVYCPAIVINGLSHMTECREIAKNIMIFNNYLILTMTFIFSI